MPIKLEIDTRGMEKLRRTFDGIEESAKTGVSDYINRLTDELMQELRMSAPKDTEEVVNSLDIRVLRDEANRASLMILATSPHAQFTEIWPRPHWVSMEKHPEVREWAMRHNVKPYGRYLWVYGAGGAGLRAPQFWFSDAVQRVFERYGGSQLLAAMNESFNIGRGWWGQREAHRRAALLGWQRRRAGMTGG